MKYCRHCGHQVSDDAIFCRGCGKRLAEDAPANAPATTPAPAPGLVAEPAEVPEEPQSASLSTETARLKSKSKLPLIIAIVLLALIGGYAFMAFWPGFHTNTPPVNTASSSNLASTASNSANSSASAPADSNASTQNKNSASSNTSSNQAPATKPSASSVPSTSTDKRPTFDEFDWFYDLPRLDAAPSNASPLKDFDAISGGWKAMLLYDDMGDEGVPSRELLNVSISGAKGNFSVILDLYQAQYGQEVEDETSIEDVVLNGEWNNAKNTLTATGGVTLNITTFYAHQGTQYALGRLTFSDGGGTVLMMRP